MKKLFWLIVLSAGVFGQAERFEKMIQANYANGWIPVWCKKSDRRKFLVLMWVLGLIFSAELVGFGLPCLKSGVKNWGITA